MKTIKVKDVDFNYQKSLKNRNISRIDKFITIEKYINRPMASLVVRAVINTRITPNGLPIGSHAPMEIAVAIAAELIAARNNALGAARDRLDPCDPDRVIWTGYGRGDPYWHQSLPAHCST